MREFLDPSSSAASSAAASSQTLASESTPFSHLVHPPGGRPNYDPIERRDTSLKWNTTEGAVDATPVLSLDELRAIITAEADCTVVVSDVHGYPELLLNALSRLGLVTFGHRTSPLTRLVSIGDLVDGRSRGDYEWAVLGERFFDEIVVGNHEAALMGGVEFTGMHEFQPPELLDCLWRMARSGKLRAASVAEGILLTHAGISKHFADGERDPHELAARLNDHWVDFLGRPSTHPKELFQVGLDRLSIEERTPESPESGGVLWENWSHLLLSHPEGLRQIVGHTSRGRPERTENYLLHNIDLAGYRVGLAVIRSNGEVVVGSDYPLR